MKNATNGQCHAKTCLMSYANNKGTNPPTHLCSLISAFIISSLAGIICILAIFKVSKFQLYVVSMSAETDLNLTWLQSRKTRICVTLPKCNKAPYHLCQNNIG